MITNRLEILIPGTTWTCKSDNYIHSRFIKEFTEVKIESLQINTEDAFVIFQVGSNRTMLEANKFRKMFKRSVSYV